MLSGFSPRSLLALGPRKFCVANCPLALGLCLWSLEMETNSKCALLCGEGGWGLKRPCVHWPHHPPFCQLGRNPARAHFRKGTKLTSGSCFREVTLSSGNQAQPQCVFAQESSAFWFLPLPIAHHRNMEVLRCLKLPGHLCFAGGRWSWKPTSNVLSFGEKADGA